MTTYLPFRRFWILAFMCCVAACADGDEVHRDVVTATIENNLPGDGCSYVVHIHGDSFAPDAATLAIIRGRSLAIGNTTVQVEYTITGRTGTVECGPPPSEELPEVSLVFLDS